MLLIGNGRMITRDTGNPFYEDGCVAIEGETIKEVGSTQDLKKKYPSAEFVDAKGGVIMPGLINMHNHIYSAFARGLSINGYNPHTFMDILSGQWWKMDRTMNLADSYHSAMATYVDCVKSGVTTVFDHHASYGAVNGSLFELSRAAKELGVRTCLCYEISDRDGKDKMKEAVLENAAFIKDALQNGADMQRGMMGMHAAFTLSDETLDYAASETPEGTGFHIHVAEGMDDVYDSLQKYGKRIVNRLFDKGILGKQTLVVHCIHISPEERQLIKESDSMVVHNPESNMGNAVGCGAVIQMMKEGLLVGLGTDGYTNDMIESYKVGNIIHKHNLCNPNVAWSEIPEMLFSNNAIEANRYFKKPLGVLKEGAAADVVVAEYNPLTPMNGQNCNSHILFGMNGRSFSTTVINGQVKMKDRQLVGVDEEKILADARAQAADLWKRINS